MSKQLLPNEIAEIVTGLLIAPDILGELDSAEKHRDFIFEISAVIAAHCGGDINGVYPGDSAEGLDKKYSSPLVSVSPNDDLPSYHQNVWSAYDPEGWEEDAEEAGKTANYLSVSSITRIRQRLQALIPSHAMEENIPQRFDMKLEDWCALENPEYDPDGKTVHSFLVQMDNQPSIDFSDVDGNPVLAVLIEINKGVPALHIALEDGDPILHIHAANNTLVLTPDDSATRFQNAVINEYSYHSSNALMIE